MTRKYQEFTMSFLLSCATSNSKWIGFISRIANTHSINFDLFQIFILIMANFTYYFFH